MINVVKNGKVYEISFQYDECILEIIRSLSQRNYVPNCKKWVIPENVLPELLDKFKGTEFESMLNITENVQSSSNSLLDIQNNIPDVDISGIKTYVQDGYQLYEHQKNFLKFALYRQIIEKNDSGFLLCDEPGLGKTLEGMNLALYNKRNNNLKHCLIICCVNSAKYNWIDDIEKHTNGKFHPYLLGSRKKRNGDIKSEITNKDKFHDIQTLTVFGSEKPVPFFLVTNVESLKMKDGKYYPIANAIIDKINCGEIGMIIIDEIHKNMSPSSMQGKQMLAIKNKTGKKCKYIPMTGTPIVNRPTDVFLPLRLVDGVDCTSFYQWIQNFCIHSEFGLTDVIGYKNIDVLRMILQSNMLRRRKCDVLDMPPIVFIDKYVLNTLYQAKLYQQYKSEVQSNREEIVHSMNPLAEMYKLCQVCGSPELLVDDIDLDDSYLSKNSKLQELLDILDEIHERNEKVIVFSKWVKPLFTLFKYIDMKYANSVCMFHGELSITERNANKYTFINDHSKFILLGTIGALGVSHTFTCASNVIFYDEPFTYADKQQAWERVYRIGTRSSVNVYTILTRNTVEERIHKLVYDKKEISDAIVDNLDIRNHPEIFDYLLS